MSLLLLLTGSRQSLFHAARDLVAQNHTGPAVVVAQTAVEVAVESAIDIALSNTSTPEPLKAWIIDKRVRGRSWDPTAERVSDLWRALTGDRITGADGWEDYKRGVDARHAFVHAATAVSAADAEAFIAAAESVADHVLRVVQPTSPS